MVVLVLVSGRDLVSSPAAIPGYELFTNGPPLQIGLVLSPTALESLRKDRRTPVSATITEGTNTYRDVAVHLKGAAGSFRAIDDKPALTLNFARNVEKQSLHGLRKIHLNNSVQDMARRWQRLNEALDVERFISFMAMEVMICHWDGYCLARNNFRIYHDMDSNRMVFFPHGTDQLFGDPNASMRPRMNGLVAQALMRTTGGRKRYVDRYRELATNIFKAEQLTNRIAQVVAAIKPTLAAYDPDAAQNWRNEAAALSDRILQRAAVLNRQIYEPEPTPVPFPNGIAKIVSWETRSQEGNARHDQPRDGDRATLHIDSTGSHCIASWRRRVLLDGGDYRFEGRARSAQLGPEQSPSGTGGGIRISGGQRKNSLVGDSPWSDLSFEFTVLEGGDEVELVCELRANKGAIWFDADSLRLVRVK